MKSLVNLLQEVCGRRKKRKKRNRSDTRRRWGGLAAGLCVISSIPFAAAAAAGTIEGMIYLRYYESTDGAEPISGAGFSCMKVAELKDTAGNGEIHTEIVSSVRGSDGNLIEITADTDPAELAKKIGNDRGEAKLYTTDGKGEAVIRDLDDGIYLIREVEPAPDHLASAPFLCCIPYTAADGQAGLKYEVTAEPKPQPCGRVIISKQVAGNAAESDREFHFSVTFSQEGDYRLTGPDGTAAVWSDGMEITLKGGESAAISMIPVGVRYQVKEKEANTDGYQTDSSGASGTIRRTTDAKASFVNSRYNTTKVTPSEGGAVKTGDNSRILLMLLLLAGSGAAVIFLLRGGKDVSL